MQHAPALQSTDTIASGFGFAASCWQQSAAAAQPFLPTLVHMPPPVVLVTVVPVVGPALAQAFTCAQLDAAAMQLLTLPEN